MIGDIKSYLKKIIERGIYKEPTNKPGGLVGIIKKRGEYQPLDSNFFEDNLIGEHLEKVMQEMINTITEMPHISSIKGIIPVYNIIRAISIGSISAIVAFKGLKMILSYDENSKLEGKQLMGRIAYSVVLGNLSLPFIDVMIDFNNMLIKTLTSRFSLVPLLGSNVNKAYGVIIISILLLLELFCTIKIMIQFWMRMSELVFTGVISPLIFTLWINEQWGGYLRQWTRRVVVLIFSQFCQILMLILYSMIVSGLALSGFNGLCLAIGTLLLIMETPKVLNGLMDTGSNFRSVKRTINSFRKGGIKDIIFK